ncbi:ABC transporter ATP-binding protein [Amnibacterium endophyticum]|uniref:ABC transporter ATP-binding protein n=1 Tax=Amnibacterium endophyticum TaxID=2109337 RepID=A0ABW4L9Y0_9MICO
MIEVTRLTKRYGATTAVDDVSFRVEPGRVTGFLGPNGAGKSTTLRMVLGLDRPTSGRATVEGRAYADLPAPIRSVGAMLDSRSIHPGRTAAAHLRSISETHGLPRRRVGEVLELTGLAAVARRRVGTFSLGMTQRLGIATALLGDPAAVLLDEPVNGLDPEGVLWIRALARRMAAEGRAVLISSHLMSEVEQTVDHVLVLGAGRVLADSPLQQLLEQEAPPRVRVRAEDVARLVGPLVAAGASVSEPEPHVAEVTGLTADRVARIAGERDVVLTALAPVERSLEEAYFALTAGAARHRSQPLPGADDGAGTTTKEHRA